MKEDEKDDDEDDEDDDGEDDEKEDGDEGCLFNIFLFYTLCSIMCFL